MAGANRTVLFEPSGRVVKITLNRPEAMNSVNAQLWQEMGEALDRFEKDPDLWVAVITGAGDRSFCAGADLKAAAAGEMVISEQMQKWGFAGVVRHYVGKPVIAAVNGFALGGGTEIALACDLVVASEKSSFGLPEVKWGIIAGAGGLLRMPRQVPLKVAMHCVMTGEPLTADQAMEWGLVNAVVPHAEVVPAALALAERICQNAPVAVRASKEIIYRGLDAPLDFPGDAWSVNERYTQLVMQSLDAREGPRAFAEKRRPSWKGC